MCCIYFTIMYNNKCNQEHGGDEMTETLNYEKLVDRMHQYRYNQTTLAKALKISRESMNSTINSNTPFTLSEIIKICQLLDIPHSKIGEYFFIKKLEEAPK